MIKQMKSKTVQKKRERENEIDIEENIPEAPKLTDFEIVSQIDLVAQRQDAPEGSEINSFDSSEKEDLPDYNSAEKDLVTYGTGFGLDNSDIFQNKDNDIKDKTTCKVKIIIDSAAKCVNTNSEVKENCKVESQKSTEVECSNKNENKVDENCHSELSDYSVLSNAIKFLSHNLHEASAPIGEKCYSSVINPLTPSVKSTNRINESLDLYKYNFNKVLKDNIIPFTDEKLSEFYQNSELEDVKNHINKIIHKEITDPSKQDDYFYRLLVEYIQSRNQSSSYQGKINELRKRLNVCTSAMWTVWDDIKTGEKTCNDGNTVSYLQKYTQALFNTNIHDEFVYILKELKNLTYEDFLRESFTSSFLRLKIQYYLQCVLTSCPEFTHLETSTVTITCLHRDSYFQECLQHLKQVIGVLFIFQRKENVDVDKGFLIESQEWLTRLVSVLLRVGTWKDQIFLLNQVLRCPGGVGEWATPFIQLPSSPISADPFNNEQINHIMTVLHIFLSPIEQNDSGITKVDSEFMANNSNPWLVVDSDGEIEGDTNQKLFLLRENDLVSILNQIPFGYLFKEIFQFRENEINFADMSSRYLLKLFSFSTEFIKILLNGLKLYSVKRYKQFNKRLGQLICHIVHYAAEALTKFKTQNGEADEMARIQAEFDNFFLKSTKFIYSAKKHGPWQFLATMPYGIASATVILKIYALLQLNENQQESVLSVNFAHFEEKFSQLLEEDQYYLLTTFANMALARDLSEIEFIRNVLFQLFYIGFVGSQTVDHSYKNVIYLLCSICTSHPFLISEILAVQNQLFASDPAYDERLSVYLWLKLPLDMWKPGEADLEIISKWLLEPLSSLRSELARIILQSLNCGTSQGELFMSPQTHRAIAHMLMQASLKLLKETEQGFIKNVSNLVYHQSQEQTVSDWTWTVLLKLRLHLLDKPESCLYKYLTNLQEYLDDIPEVDADVELHNLVLRKYPIACFIALMTTSQGHSVPVIHDRGFELVEVLLNDGKYNPGIACLEFATSLFLDCPDSLYKCQKFISILHHLISADNTYVQKAKSFISNNFPGPVLQSLELMIQNQLNIFRAFSLKNFNDCIGLWLMSLSRIPLWNQEIGALYLMDKVLQNAFFNFTSTQSVTAMLENLSEETRSTGEPKSSFSSLVGWMNAKSALPSLLPKGFNGDHPWLSYWVIQIEFEIHERKTCIWPELLKELHASRDKKTDVDGSLKKVCNLLACPVRVSGALAIYRWTHQILNTDIDHPLVPLLWQRFFSLYLCRGFGSTDCGSMGEKFFDGVVNQRLLKQLNQRLIETLDRFGELRKEQEDDMEGEESHYRKCQNLFQTYSLWLNDPKLHESHLNVHHLSPDYHPELLGLLIHGNDASWTDFIQYRKIEENFQKPSRDWSKLKCRVICERMSQSTSFKMEKSQADILKERFNSYETPLPPPALTHVITKNVISSLNPKDLMDSHRIMEFVRPQLDKLMAYRDQYTFYLNQNLSLAFDLQELSTKLYGKTVTRTVLKEQCLGTNKSIKGELIHVACTGPAVINFKFEEWKSNENIQRQFDQCKKALDENILKNLSHVPSYLSVTAVSIDVVVEELIKEYKLAVKREKESEQSIKLKESGVNLFYELVGKWDANMAAVPPLQRAFDRYINILGKTFLENNCRENEGLLHHILNNDAIDDKLLRYFTPNAVTTPQDFLSYYSTAMECDSPEKLIMVLSKFDLIRFLHENEPKYSVRSSLISSVARRLTFCTQESVENKNIVKVLNEHLGILLKYDFPEHYGEVLNFLLDSSRKRNISTDTWFVFLNSLLFDATFLLESGQSIKRLKQYFVKCASDQGIPLDVVKGTMAVLASNFNSERTKLGTYGLYSKYGDYVEPLFIFFGMLSYSCVAKTLELDTGSLSEKLTQKLWPLLSDLYSPWLIPYRCSNDEAKKDGSSDAGIWLPWSSGEESSATFCASIFTESVHFILDTLPGFNNVLSYLWYFYVANFAQVYVKDFILNVVHESLASLPWETFFPSLQDVELMVQVVSQYLPSSHSFLGNIFVNVKWPELVQYCGELGDVDLATKYHICLLHLLIKLPLEPSLKQNKKVLVLLNEANEFAWHLVDARSFDVVLNWFVSSCDPRIILMDDKLDYFKLDSAIFRLLKTCSGLVITAKQFHPTTLTKRSLFVKACVKWFISSNRRFRSKESPLFKEALCRLWDDMDSVVNATAVPSRRVDEMVILLGDFLAILSEPGLTSLVEDTICDCVTKRQSKQVVFGLLRCVGSAVENPDQYGKMVEVALESYFGFVEDSNWEEIIRILAPFPKGNAQLDKALIDRKCFLTFYATLLKRVQGKESRNVTKSVLADLLHILTEEKLSPSVEPKLLLLMTLSLELVESEVQSNEKDGFSLLIRLFSILNGFVDDKGSGFLSAVGLRRPSFSNRYKLVCLSVCGCIAMLLDRRNPDSNERIERDKLLEALNSAENNKVYQGISQYVSYAKEVMKDVQTISDVVELVRDVGLKLFNVLFLK